MRALATASAVGAAAFVACGRGEAWIRPSDPPPASTLTNEARCIEWKWRTDVSNPATGLREAEVRAKVEKLMRELEPKEDKR